MPERPDVSPPKSTRSLAERFGLTENAVTELLRGTHEEYTPTAALPTIDDSPTAPIVEAAGILAEDSSMPSSTDNPPPPSAVNNSAHKSAMPVSGGFIAALFTILLIVLGIAVSFQHGCFEQRKAHHKATAVDTVQTMLHEQTEKASTAPEPPTETPPGQVPPEALAVPNDEAPKNGNAAPAHPAARHSAPRPSLQTTSSFEAEEQLAEFRADGNSKAHIKKTSKNGATRYEVYSH